MATGVIQTLGKRTITGMLAADGRQDQDWSAAYRMFGKGRIKLKELFAAAMNGVLENIGAHEPLYTMMDDTLVRKRGKKVSGTGWKRDPLGPAFHTNFVWGQRYLQISAALPDFEVEGRSRGIPVDFHHAPTPGKPRKNAPEEEWNEYKRQQKLYRISTVGAQRLAELREQVPDREIICAFDGGFTNKEVFRSVPDNTVLIGRIRKDASLFKVPDEPSGTSRGRKKYYGDSLPTPEQIRKDETVPWQKVLAFAAGKIHEFEVKTIAPVRWKSSGNRDMLIVVVRPLAYRPRKGAKLLYRDPAYLICSDPQFPIEQVLKAYLWRWEIEVNFRDEKTIIGVGEAQVRTPNAVQTAPAFIVAVYAFLLLAAHSIKATASSIPQPKWFQQPTSARCSTNSILSLFRSELWGLPIDQNKNGFASNSPSLQSRFFSRNSPSPAVCYARK